MSCPTPTGSGESLLVMPRSASVPARTVLVALAVLLPATESATAAVTVTLSVITVPATTPVLTL